MSGKARFTPNKWPVKEVTASAAYSNTFIHAPVIAYLAISRIILSILYSFYSGWLGYKDSLTSKNYNVILQSSKEDKGLRFINVKVR